MTLLATLATIFGVVNGIANLPQIHKIYKRKSAKDISVITYLILVVGSIGLGAILFKKRKHI